MDERSIEIIKKAYHSYVPYDEIARKVGLPESSTKRIISGLIKDGIIERRIPKGQLERQKRRERVYELYRRGYTIEDISFAMEMPRGNVTGLIRDGKKKGIINEREYDCIMTNGNVSCGSSMSDKCIYGKSKSDTSGKGFCNYILCTGHLRGCSYLNCDKYVDGNGKKEQYKVPDCITTADTVRSGIEE